MSKKKAIREKFRDSTFARDGFKCACCGAEGFNRQGETINGKVPLDAHHITDRNLMPNGGYVKENGISVCDSCHESCEVFHQTGEAEDGFSPADLYELIGSSLEEAIKVSEKLI